MGNWLRKHQSEEELALARQRLTDEIVREAVETQSWTGRAQFSTDVMEAMSRVLRHAFVPPDDVANAYANRPLSIGFGQTISQPFIVAMMTDLLDLRPSDRVLEVGTGCGYQTAVLAEIAHEVFTIERVPELAEAARQRLAALAYENVHCRVGDGYLGWESAAPFDAIIVTAAPLSVPQALVRQIACGGRLVIPVGPRNETQALLRCTKEHDGKLRKEKKLPVAFVPMVHGHE